jgi:thiol-disulfide isomerase/thioredoxin
LRVDKTVQTNRVDVYFEDLREDSMQPQSPGGVLAAPKREYTIWRGTLGNWYSHTPSFTAAQGIEVNGALRRQLVPIDPAQSYYFLVSGRSANLEGTLGSGVDAAGDPIARPGHAVTDLCQTLGYHQGPSWPLFTCGKDFTLVDTHGQTRSLYELRGKVVILDFSAEWCAPCHAEADVIENLYQDYIDRGVEILTVLMDEESTSLDWNGRPAVPECRVWEDRPGASPDHTFDCWADPVACTPAGGNPAAQCSGAITLQAWPKYDAWNALPTNVIIDQGLRVAYTGAGYNEALIRLKLDLLVGAADQCLH